MLSTDDDPADIRPRGRILLDALLAPATDGQLTRFVILRLLGLVYLVAFVSLARQVVPLIGPDGLLPAGAFLGHVQAMTGSRLDGFLRLPTLFWAVTPSNALLEGLAWLGAGLSLIVVLGFANAPLMAILWWLYLSFVHIGQLWYGYGWEIQLAETGFLAIFLCPLIEARPFPRKGPPRAVLWLFRWLTFRIMLGAGLIKIRGDECWRDLTCLYYHYETQPIPSPASRFLHFFPRELHQLGVLYNHLAELILPWFAIAPLRRARTVAGALMILFQVFLILSGNLSFLNWLTIVPMLACFDDRTLERIIPLRPAKPAGGDFTTSRRLAIGALLALIAILSVAPTLNLLSGEQIMNASFDPFAIVNTYGAFGSVGRERNEIILEGTSDPTIGPDTRWTPYELPCKPGDPTRRPCLITPYHYRLDWQIWFAAMDTPEGEPWLVHLIAKLLKGDPQTARLLATNPFPATPPRFIRAELYRYRFAPAGTGRWWDRERIGPWLPALSLDDPRLRHFLAEHDWLPWTDALED